MDKVILNNGDELNGHVLETETRLFVYLFGISLTEAFELLNNPENTKMIKWERYGTKGTIKGYKRLMSISVEQDNMICASLKK